jgi:hypothetical protein
MAVPYLKSPPAVVSIDGGRQLFVDDFLIERTDFTRTFHLAEKYSGNPVLVPTTPDELGLRWTPKVGQDGSLNQNPKNDPHVQETTSAQS